MSQSSVGNLFGSDVLDWSRYCNWHEPFCAVLWKQFMGKDFLANRPLNSLSHSFLALCSIDEPKDELRRTQAGERKKERGTGKLLTGLEQKGTRQVFPFKPGIIQVCCLKRAENFQPYWNNGYTPSSFILVALLSSLVHTWSFRLFLLLLLLLLVLQQTKPCASTSQPSYEHSSMDGFSTWKVSLIKFFGDHFTPHESSSPWNHAGQ